MHELVHAVQDLLPGVVAVDVNEPDPAAVSVGGEGVYKSGIGQRVVHDRVLVVVARHSELRTG